jgi:hypothetical protein
MSMTGCDLGLERTVRTAEDARTRVGIALSLVELAAEVLAKVPTPETAFPREDRELFRYLQAAEAAKSWLVGHGMEDGVECPAMDSALGDGLRIYGWDEAETERHFAAAIRDWSERQ